MPTVFQPSEITPVMILDASIEMLHRVPWGQFDVGDPEGPVCGYGALIYSTWALMGQRYSKKLRPVLPPPVYQRFWTAFGAVHEYCKGDGGTFIRWNDLPERTVEDVLLVFKQARTALEDTNEG